MGDAPSATPHSRMRSSVRSTSAPESCCKIAAYSVRAPPQSLALNRMAACARRWSTRKRRNLYAGAAAKKIELHSGLACLLAHSEARVEGLVIRGSLKRLPRLLMGFRAEKQQAGALVGHRIGVERLHRLRRLIQSGGCDGERLERLFGDDRIRIVAANPAEARRERRLPGVGPSHSRRPNRARNRRAVDRFWRARAIYPPPRSDSANSHRTRAPAPRAYGVRSRTFRERSCSEPRRPQVEFFSLSCSGEAFELLSAVIEAAAEGATADVPGAALGRPRLFGCGCLMGFLLREGGVGDKGEQNSGRENQPAYCFIATSLVAQYR